MGSASLSQWLLAIGLLLLILLLQPISGSVSKKHRREVIQSKHGAVATDHKSCSQIGRDVLRDGGNAVDASVSAALCLGLVRAASSGLGGGAFMLIRMADGKAKAFDMRETAPLGASPNMYAGNAKSKSSGALSVAVPGELAGLHEAWKQNGKLPWKRLVMPVALLAEKGFEITPYLYMQMNKKRSGILADKGLREIYTLNGTLLKPGEICHNKKLAHTLRAISKHGLKAFYSGSVGMNLVRDVQKLGGILTMKDLKSYRVKVSDPITADIMGVRILGMPPPASGTAGMILILNILEQYGIPSGVSGSLGLHRLIESLKHMMAVRMNLGDPAFVNISQVLSDMLSLKFAKSLKKTVNDKRTFDPSYYGGKWNIISDHGTSHVSIVDSERNAVSMTNTINAYFGSQILSPSTGIVLNNEMDDFSVPGNFSANVPPPAPANFIHPMKRPLSSMTPTIVLKDGHLKAVVGAAGGGMIIAAVTEVFLNYFAKGMDPFSSILSPRSYHQLIPNVVQYENWTTVIGDHFELDAGLREALKKKGHVLQPLAGGSICNFVVHNFEKSNGGDLTAVSDPRRGGVPAGY